MDHIEQEIDQMAETLEKALSGEGSKGGKVVGHTRSGKPIYEAKSHAQHMRDREATPQGQRIAAAKSDDHHKEYSVEDHIDALAFHSIAHKNLKNNGKEKSKEADKHYRAISYHDDKLGEKTDGHKFTDSHKKYGRESKDHYEKNLNPNPDKKPSDPIDEGVTARGEPITAKNNLGDSVREANAGAHVQEMNRKTAEMLKDGKISKEQHDEIVAENSKGYKNRMKKGFETLMETILDLGPEGLRKAMPTLSEEQKTLLGEVLSKATEMPKAATPEGGPEIIQEASEKKKSAKRRNEEDEKLMVESNAEIKNQGDDSVKPGQIIKSEAGQECSCGACEACKGSKMSRMVARMKERKMEKSACIDAAKAKGDEDLVKAIEAQWGEELEKAGPGMPQNPPSPEELAQRDEQRSEKELEQKMKRDANAKAKESKIVEQRVNKSVPWTQGTQELLKASIRRGQNAHYTIEDQLLKSEQERSEILAKGGYLNEEEVSEELKKSREARSVSVNDILEKGLDMGEMQIQNAQLLAKSKPSGAFNVQSFTDEEIAKSMGLTVEEAEELVKSGEGSRGGKVVGHTKSGKPIYEGSAAANKLKQKAFADKQNPDLSPQKKAEARAMRNNRSISTPTGEHKRYFDFQAKEGAKAGKKGEKVYGAPAGSHKEYGVHQGGGKDKFSHDMPGEGTISSAGVSAAGVNARYGSTQGHKNESLREGALDRAKEQHRKKLAELKEMPRPNLTKGDINDEVEALMKKRA